MFAGVPGMVTLIWSLTQYSVEGSLIRVIRV